MKFLVDAQLPRKLSYFLQSKGFDSIHTLDLPSKNLTPDPEIIELCKIQNRVIVTKDSDFYESKIIRNMPQKLLIISTGNINNELLIKLFDSNIEKINELLIDFDIVEIGKNSIITK